MTNTFKQKLLLGTALVAVGAFAAGHAFAADEFSVDGNDSGTFTTTGPDETADTALDWDAGSTGGAVAVANHDLQVNNSGTLNFSANATIGDATTTTAGIQAGVTGKTLTIANNNGGGVDRTATVTGGIDVGSLAALNLVVNGSTTDGDGLTLDVNGNVNLGTGTLSIVGQNNSSDAAMNISGNLTSGTVTLDENTSTTTLTFDGLTTAQTVSSTIVAGNDNEGDIVINNASGVTFTGTIGAVGTEVDLITIAGTNVNSAATFKAAVSVNTGIVLGDGANANTNTVTFDGTTAAFTVTSKIDGTAGDTDKIVVSGGKTITFDGVIGTTAIDELTISGTSTKMDANDNVTAVLVTVGSGATLDLDDNLTTTGGVTLAGEINVTGSSTIDGNIQGSAAGTGTLNIDAATSLLDNVGSTITINSIDVASGITLTINPDASNTIATSAGLNLNDDGVDNATNTTLAFTNGAAETTTVNSDITTSFDSEGIITIADANASVIDFNGNVGTSSKALQSVAVAGGNNQTVTAAKNWYVDTTTIDDADTLRFDGTTAQTVSGTIDGVGAGDGAIIVGNTGTNSSVTFNSAIGTTTGTIGDFTVVDGSTAIFGGTAGTTTHQFADDLTIEGTMKINQGITVTAADYQVGTTEGTLQLVIGTTSAGVAQNATLATGDAINWDDFDGTTAGSADVLLKQGTGVIVNGQDFKIVNGTGAVTNLAAAGETVDDEYALFNFKAYTGDVKVIGGSDNSDVVVEATHTDTGSVTINENNANAASGLLDVTVAEYAADDDLADVYDAVTRSSTSDIDEAVEATQPSVDGGNVVAATNVATITSNIIQLASLDAEGSGISAGNISNGLRAWGQVFGQSGTQDRRDNIDGFDIDTYGFALGLDTQALADQLVAGLAFSYANSSVDSDNANRASTDIDTYQVTLYGTYNVDKATYVSGQVGYAFGNNDVERQDIGGTNLDAKGSYDSNQFLARLEAGRAYEVGTITTLTPKLTAAYNYYDADSYRETGAGGAGLEVDQDSLSSFNIGAGVNADWLFQQADGSYIKPQVRLGASYDLIGDEVETTSQFIGGGSAFQTKGFDSQNFSVDAGVGVTYFATNNWELTANYDYEWKQDYDSHAGFLRAAYKF